MTVVERDNAISLKRRDRSPCHRSQISLLTGLDIAHESKVPLYRQIYGELKRLILDGALAPGVMLSSPRALADQIKCSRHTVATAYDYLVYEGMLRSEHGVGTFVSELAAEMVSDRLLRRDGDATAFSMPPLSRFGQRLTEMSSRDETDPLQLFGASDSSLFPFEIWNRIHSRVWGGGKKRLGMSPLIGGHPDLREAISRLVQRTRGIQATPEQILITSGTTQSLDLLMRVLLDPGDKLMVENPGRPKAALLARAQGIELVPVDVDAAGLDVELGTDLACDARAALVTASHHYPTGATLSLERRIQLLSWASRTGGWIFEDDYDGELVAAGQPILPLFSLGRNNRVVYMGTFSKSIGSHLRIGYIIAHHEIISAIESARYYIDYFPPLTPQPVLATFIEGGHLESHIRRMRKVYSERQYLAKQEITRQAEGLFELSSEAPSLFLPAWLAAAEPLTDKDIARLARSAEIPAFDMSSMYLTAARRQGIVLGTGRMDLKTIPEKIGLFIRLLNRSRPRR
ncbi:PLP-dependent aminotransferase family protein [Bosea sp. (in: a-proteobacteria)]|jgi:GntR family transcriptional regulator/MocR family aminotransferase|uniref:MocR-like pyridoxine biosynthesis transcription factor PdxR n=1 Tax=Bosea sp. (in: a-proteobacteria) TaxID=1871050 RepID=UPI002DDCB6A8|nr:PLP-dependent aminotransferase family protein [Bosea sp. (in: a-proteobacteria)]HEV2510272.1 PLP-dependent aminotransferase family protein [Bosea sp. (in: a-proteobacteria)]